MLHLGLWIVDDVMSKRQARPLVLCPVALRDKELGRVHGRDDLYTVDHVNQSEDDLRASGVRSGVRSGCDFVVLSKSTACIEANVQATRNRESLARYVSHL